LECKELEKVAEAKKVFDEFRKRYEKSLETRLRAYVRTALGLIGPENRKKVEFLLEKSLSYSWGVGWARIMYFNPQIRSAFSWISNSSVEILLIFAAQKKIEKSFFLIEERFNDAFEAFAYNHLRKFYFSNYLSEKVEESITLLWKIIWNKFKTFNPFEGTFYTWGTGILNNIVKTKPNKGEFSDSVSIDEEVESFDENSRIQKKAFDLIDPESPDFLYAREGFGEEILKNFFEDTGYPWQILCSTFMFMGWKPQKIVEELSGMNLNLIFERMNEDFISNSSREKEQLESFFYPLKNSLSRRIEETVPASDSKSRKNLETVFHLTAGEASLNAFFSNNPPKNISDWNSRVLRRLRKKIL